jgi:outer membrane murein-binding lipoprotein Lpp
MSMEFSIGGFNIKGWMVAVGLPVLSSVAGGVWWSYDTLQRFYGVEAGIQEVVDKSASFDKKAGELSSRIQTLEQAVVDNDVRGLNTKLAQLSTNMQQILEQQKVLLDLRSQVDKATTVTDNLDDTLKVLQTEIDDIWDAYDSLVDNPLGN